jgi:hypothetical protein
MYSRCEKCGGDVSDVSISPCVKLVHCKKCDSIKTRGEAIPEGLIIDMDEEHKKKAR